MKICIVEDDLVMAWMLEEICRNAGHNVIGRAPTARSAMRFIELERPDCLLLDYNLAGDHDGLELLEQAKRMLPWLFTILITGWDINDIAARMGAIPPDRILRKPVAPETLVTILDREWRRRGFANAARGGIAA